MMHDEVIVTMYAARAVEREMMTRTTTNKTAAARIRNSRGGTACHYQHR
jgi:hypothetical protein